MRAQGHRYIVMRGSTNSWLKQKIAWILVVLMSINSFAAVVGDNDGAAFITKGEFDSLKNDFQSQIDRYSTSIDNKIDGAVANYLSGVKIAAKKNIDPYVSNYNEIRWMHGPYMYKSTRTFPNVTKTSSGTPVDSVDWNFIQMENRRQSGGDQFWWFFDVIAARTGSHHITMRLNRLGYCNPAWGQGNDSIGLVDGGGWSWEGTKTRRGATLFLQCTRENDQWVIEKNKKPIVGEIGLLDEIHILPHHGTKYGNYPDDPDDVQSIFGIDPRHITLSGSLTDCQFPLELLNLKTSNDDLLYYCIPNLKRVTNQTTRASASIALASRVTLKNNPQAFQSAVTQDLFMKKNDGTNRYGHSTGTGYQWPDPSPTSRQWAYQNAAACNYHDIRWQTEKQFNYDNDNLIYAMWGTDVIGDMNVAPYPITQNDMTYIPLQDSPNYFAMQCEPIGLNVNTINPLSTRRAYAEQEEVSFTHWIRGIDNNWTTGEIHYEDLSFTVPLFYRIGWANLYSRAFINKDSNVPLGKGEGMPIVVDSLDAGTLTLKFKYEEKADTDMTLVTLTPDNKIKTYFKNKKFTDTSGNYYSGRISTAVDAPVVSLNGTEWTGKEVTVIIDIKKGDDVWMRIDPLTSNGIYCKMTDFKCELVTNS